MDLTQADDDDFNRSIGRFEAALTAREPDIPEPGVRRLLLAVDGSNQDSTARKLAELLARGRQAPVSVLFAYEGPANPSREDHTNRVVAELQDAGVQARAVPRAPEADPRRSYDRILAAVAEQECDLVVVPAPYLDDFTELGRDSVGTNLDLLMARSSVPLLVVREPNDDPAECFDQVLLPITPYEPPIVPAASWALHLARGLRIVAVVDRAMIESAGTLLKDFDELDEEALAGLRRPQVAGLIAALQRLAAQRNIACRVSVRSGEILQEVLHLAEGEQTLLVASGPRQPRAAAYQRALALTRLSKHPLLMVLAQT